MEIDLKLLAEYCDSCGPLCRACELVDETDTCMLDARPSVWRVIKIYHVLRKFKMKSEGA